MPPETKKETIKARELLTLLLDDEEFNANQGPRRIVGFDHLLAKMDKLADAITHSHDNDGKKDEDGQLVELMKSLTANVEALREIAHTHPDPAPSEHSEGLMVAMTENIKILRNIAERPVDTVQHSDEVSPLLTVIAKNTMRTRVPWEFTVKRNQAGFTEKIIARPMGN